MEKQDSFWKTLIRKIGESLISRAGGRTDAEPLQLPPSPAPKTNISSFSEGLPGILSDEDITEQIAKHELIRFHNESAIQPCSYDMTVGTIFKDGRIINAGGQRKNLQVTLKPGEVISLFTKEELRLPHNIAATAFSINAMSSQGILVLNPGHVDPGFDGPLTVRVINIRRTEKTVTTGTEIFTIVFERLPVAVGKPYQKMPSREEREIRFNERDLEVNPRSLAELVFNQANPNYIVRKDQVIGLIRRDTQVWLNTFLSAIAAFAGVAALIIALYPKIRTEDSQRPASIQNQPYVQPTMSPAAAELPPVTPNQNANVNKSGRIPNHN